MLAHPLYSDMLWLLLAALEQGAQNKLMLKDVMLSLSGVSWSITSLKNTAGKTQHLWYVEKKCTSFRQWVSERAKWIGQGVKKYV